MSFSISAGTRLYVGTPLEVYSLSAFQGVSYTEVGEIESFGEIDGGADVYEVIDPGLMRSVRFKRAADSGILAVVAADDQDDPGQNILRQAQRDVYSENHAFKIALPLPSGQQTSFFLGCVLKANRTPGDVNSVRKVTFAIAVNSDLLEA